MQVGPDCRQYAQRRRGDNFCTAESMRTTSSAPRTILAHLLKLRSDPTCFNNRLMPPPESKCAWPCVDVGWMFKSVYFFNYVTCVNEKPQSVVWINVNKLSVSVSELSWLTYVYMVSWASSITLLSSEPAHQLIRVCMMSWAGSVVSFSIGLLSSYPISNIELSPKNVFLSLTNIFFA